MKDIPPNVTASPYQGIVSNVLSPIIQNNNTNNNQTIIESTLNADAKPYAPNNNTKVEGVAENITSVEAIPPPAPQLNQQFRQQQYQYQQQFQPQQFQQQQQQSFHPVSIYLHIEYNELNRYSSTRLYLQNMWN